jgi:hypothetical protein
LAPLQTPEKSSWGIWSIAELGNEIKYFVKIDSSFAKAA